MKNLFKIFLLLVLQSCNNANEENPLEFEYKQLYEIIEATNFIGESTIVGVDFDGSYFWILYYKSVGDFYDNNEVKLVQYDFNNKTTLKTFNYNDNI